MSDLTRFADHCREMATAEHKPACPSLSRPRPIWVPDWIDDQGVHHGEHLSGYLVPPPCEGCVTDAERALWTRLAAEVEDYLTERSDAVRGEQVSEPTTEYEPDAVTKVSRDLTAIEDMAAALPEQAVHKANDHEIPGGLAMVSLAPVASPASWEAGIEAIEAAWWDDPMSTHEDRPNLDAIEDDWEPPLQTLCFWSEQWRREHGNEYGRRPTIASEANYIRFCLGWAWDNEPHFEDMARDINQARLRMENLLYAGRRATRTRVPCNNPGCEKKPMLVKIWGNADVQDRYRCLGCRKWYDDDDFRKAYAAQLRSQGAAKYVPLLDAVGTLKALGRAERTIRKWLAPAEHIADRCLVCGAEYEPSEYAACPAETDDDEECGGLLAPVHEDREVVEGYCELGTRRRYAWWPDLWRLHLTTETRKRESA